MNGTYVPECWNAHVKSLGYVAYVLLALELCVCKPLFNRWLNAQPAVKAFMDPSKKNEASQLISANA
eukprot:7183329-Prymnesium_polylepis.1